MQFLATWYAVLVAFAFHSKHTHAETIEGAVARSSFDVRLEDLAIAKDSRLNLVDNGVVSLVGSFRNDGLFLMICKDNHLAIHKRFVGSVLSSLGGAFVNNRNFVFDHSRAFSESIVGFTRRAEIKNYGNIWFKFGGMPKADEVELPDAPGLWNAHLSIFAPQVLNEGSIMISSTQQQIEAWMKLRSQNDVFTNNGALCLKNAHLLLENQLHGNGCVSVGPFASLDLCTTKLDPEQMLYMDPQGESADLFLCMDDEPQYPIRIRGFGLGSRLRAPGIEWWTFENDLLTLKAPRRGRYVIDLGPGYKQNLFEVFSGGLVTYSDVVEAAEPSACPCQFDYAAEI